MTESARSPKLNFLAGGGHMSERMRAHDWSASPLGRPETWPQCLRSAVSLMLGSKFPMFVAWGPELGFLYNDAYADILGDKHPGAVGRRFRDIWSEIWPDIAPLIDKAMAGEATWAENLPLTMNRHGYEERTWFTFSYSPVRDDEGEVGGMFCACTETTAKVEAEEALRASEARASGVLQGMGEGFMLLDRDFRILQMNAEGARLEERPPGEVVGLSHWDVYPGSERMPIGQMYLRAMRERVPLTLEHRFVWPDGHAAWLEVRAYPHPEGLALFYRDVTERREREEALREAEARLRALADNLPGGMVYQIAMDSDGSNRRFLYVSRGFERMTGVPAEAVLADPAVAYDLILPEYRESLAAAERAAIWDLTPFDFVAPFRRSDGEVRWSRIISAPRPLPGGSLVWDGIQYDDTERKRVEERLRESQTTFEAIANSIDPMVWSTRPDGFHDYFNKRWYDFTGMTEGAIDGEAWNGMFHPDDQERAWATWRRCLATGEPYRIEYRLRHRSGQYRWVLGRAQPVHDEAGQIKRWFGTCTDIQEIVEAREVLARSREELERLVAERTADRDRMWRLSTDIMLVARYDATIEAVNPAWTTLLGWDEGDLLGRAFMDLVHPDDVAATLAEVGRLSEGLTTLRFENRYRSKDGSYRWLSWTAVPAEELIHAVGRDITAEKEAAQALAETEEALRQAQKMEAVGQLTGGIAHDFNNLLTGIVGSLDMMQTRIAQGRTDAIERYVKAAMSSANRAAALTHRLLAFARRQPLDPKPVNANTLVTSLEDLLRRTIGEAIGLEIVTAGGLWPTLCDPHQLESAILNLAINARDAMPDGGKLTIETCNTHLDRAYAKLHPGVEPGQYICICVTDTGAGMPPDVIARAFDPFFTTKPIGQGTGLGLSMIYGFARQSEGHAKIYSEVGKGTTVKLYLPRHCGALTEEDAQGSGLTEAHRAEAGETVLVVEDEPVVRDLIVEVLADLGYRALEAQDGPSGLKVLQSRGRIDLLVTDVGLPGLNGRQLADQAREARPDLKVLFITGYAENAMFGNGRLDPGMQMMTKPFPVDALAIRIREMIES
ncbi:hybrid sensor histidine kinase/response regulator [Methylorubrum extorquens]|uniref:hybrid sensor histidine kinase/response regulator n=1 Tax=Methylorubrum extorquens TaxID=408 RepID=UPI00097286BA|nr:hybrid sensor histidine kinase/response regulator [Methylorubrum extorquens]APX86063.1 hybrid sensor histidine kinase/response regulator [Methylorubrum extorquens]